MATQEWRQNLHRTYERAVLRSPLRDANDVITSDCRTETSLLPVTCQ